MTPGETIATALEVRRGRVALASLPPADSAAVRGMLARLTDVQLARIARAQERPRGRYRVRG